MIAVEKAVKIADSCRSFAPSGCSVTFTYDCSLNASTASTEVAAFYITLRSGDKSVTRRVDSSLMRPKVIKGLIASTYRWLKNNES